MLNRFRFWRERGWTTISAADYAAAWQRHGGSVASHPEVVDRLAGLAGIPVRYLGWPGADGLQAAVPCWGRELALSRTVLKKRRQRALFDLGNAEIILPAAPDSAAPLRQRARYLSPLCDERFAGLRRQSEELAMLREPEAWSKKFRYNQRREQRLFEDAGGRVVPMAELDSTEQARIYAELFEARWGFEVPGKARLAEVFGLLREFMTGSLLMLGERPVAIQVLYRVEAPEWISVEYVNGGVDPAASDLSPGSVLTYLNTQAAWQDARALGKALRYSFGRADRDYKDRWCHRVTVFES
jgi:CelD/BcsL family acetyltransferase involved in cellulose biosynthesis